MASAKTVWKVSRIVLCLWMFAGFLKGQAQEDDCPYEISGMVMDLTTREPIPFASVRVEGSLKGSITDESGRFHITSICEGEFDVEVTHVGFKKAIHHHDSYHKDPIIYLATSDQLLESIVVEGEYNPTSFSTLHLDQLSGAAYDQNRSASLGDLASSISGVQTLSTGQNITKPLIHGLHSNRILILNNGVRHEFQNWGAEHAPEIDPSLAESLEVVKGAGTVRYGPDALGGVLLINPRQLELKSGFSGEVFSQYGTNGRSIDGGIEFQQGWHKLVIALDANFLKQGDLSAPEYSLTNSAREELSYSGAFRYHVGRFDFNGYYSHFEQELGILRGSVNGNLEDLALAIKSDQPPYTSGFSYEINNPRQVVSHDLYKINALYSLGNQDVELQYAFQKNQRQEFDVRRGTNNDVPSIDLELNTHTIDFDWNHPKWAFFTGSMGVQWTYNDNNNIPGTNTIPFIPNYNTTRVGIYAIESMELDASKVEFGVRYDMQFLSVRGRDQENDIFRDNLSFAQFTCSIGYKRALRNEIDFRTNVGMAWRPPNVNELYSFGKHQASVEYGLMRYRLDQEGSVLVDEVLDDQEKPINSEVGWKWITGLEKHKGIIKWEFIGYVNFIKNYIYARPAGVTNTVRGAFPYFIYDQTNALIMGTDLVGQYEFSNHWNIKALANYLWAMDVKNEDTFVEMPPVQVSLQLSYADAPTFLDRSVLSLESAYTFSYFQQPRTVEPEEIISMQDENEMGTLLQSNFDFVDAPNGFFLAHLRWNAGIGRWHWQVAIQNLFDQKYRINTDRLRYFADQTGRNFQLSITYIIGNR